MKRRSLFIAAAILLLSALALHFSASWLGDRLKARLLARLEQITGGRVEAAAFTLDWWRSRITIERFVLHGTEPATVEPLLALDRVEAGFRIDAFWSEGIRLTSLRLERPRIFVRVAPDGSTNLPGARDGDPDKLIGRLFDLRIGRFEIVDGLLHMDQHQWPLHLRAQDFTAVATHQRRPESYRAEIRAGAIELGAPDALVALEATLRLEPRRLVVEQATIHRRTSRLEVKGELRDWRSPAGSWDLTGESELADWQPWLPLTRPPRGRITGSLSVQTPAGQPFTLRGRLAGRNLRFENPHVRLAPIDFESRLDYSSGRVLLEDLRLRALGGEFRGSARTDGTSWDASGAVAGLSASALFRALRRDAPPWDGRIDGPVTLEWRPGLQRLATRAAISPAGDHPLRGLLDLNADLATGALQLGPSWIATSSTRLSLSGALARELQVELETSDLRDFASTSDLPVLQDPLRARGRLTGVLDAPSFTGTLETGRLQWLGRKIDALRAAIDLEPSTLHVRSLTAREGAATLTASGDIAWKDGAPDTAAPWRGELKLANAPLAETGLPISGSVSAEARLEGTPARPVARGALTARDVRWRDREAQRVTARFTAQKESIELSSGLAETREGRLQFSAAYSESGLLQFHANTAAYAGKWDEWTASVAANLEGQARRNVDTFDLTSLSGTATVQNLRYRDSALGSLTLRAEPRGQRLTLTLDGRLFDAPLSGSGSFAFGGDMNGSADLHLAEIQWPSLFALIGREPPPAGGALRADASLAGPLLDPARWKAAIRIPQLTIAARAAPPALRDDLTIRNQNPLQLEWNGAALQLRDARLAARDTSLELSGSLSPQSRTAWDLQVKGSVNLPLISSFLPDLVAQGVSTVEGTLRGPLADPLFSGRVELKGASFFLKDVANGLENVNGVLFFDRSRARLDRLRAQSGGGQLALSGFVGLAGDELTYQLTASADRVRVRYPEGISTLINATLNLTGSPARSVLGGTVTILRSGVTPRTDIASLLADAGRASVATPAAIDNEFLRNLQFDVRFETAQNAELSTMLTRNVQADLDLRLRGTPSNPALLGRASITQGELTFFGTRYDISRAEINFFNPTRIEPVINMDLETRLRGVLVTVTFSGPLNRLNLSYRSDPPLQSNDILALLTVGRSPDSTQPVIAPNTTTVQNSTFLQGSGAGLISSAAMSAVTGRMQRFFGVSRVRIDPLLTGIDRTPQARLTVEQQVSSDIIVTYITNLNRTQQQIVSVEWDFSRQFSAIAVRDENGTFGVDFFYRRRFK